MATSKSYYEYIFECLSSFSDVSFRPMMGEYILYYRGVVVGGIYDDRLLMKQTSGAHTILPNASLHIPYEGGKEMVLVEDPENRDLMAQLLAALYADLQQTKRASRKL